MAESRFESRLNLHQAIVTLVKEYGTRQGEDDKLVASVLEDVLRAAATLREQTYATRAQLQQWAREHLGG